MRRSERRRKKDVKGIVNKESELQIGRVNVSQRSL
jgi:hypothetical protein